MESHPILGVGFHWLGGLAAGSFYVAYRGVKRWSWETYWRVGGVFSWLLAPWVIGLILTNELSGVITRAPSAGRIFRPCSRARWRASRRPRAGLAVTGSRLTAGGVSG